MPATPNYALPYPLPTDPADVPVDMQELAVAAEAALNGFDSRVDATEAFDTRLDVLEAASVDYDARLDTIEPKVPANRVAPGSEGQVLTTVAGASAWAAGGSAAGSQLAYAERVSNLTVTVVPQASALLIVSAPTVLYDGSPILIAFHCPAVQTTQTINVTLWDGGTDLGILGSYGAGSVPNPVWRITPAPGNHTYHLKAFAAGGTGTILAAAGGGGIMPCAIRVSRA